MAIKLINEDYCAFRNEAIAEYLCDTDDDFASLPAAPVGSTAVSIASANVQVVNTSGEWVAFGESGEA